MKLFKHKIFSYLGIFLIFLTWLIISTAIKEDLVFPSIPVTAKSLFNLLSNSSTYLILLNSLGGLILIIIVAFVISLLLALISYRFNKFQQVIRPMMSLFKILPVPAIIIFLLVQFSQEITPYILTIMVITPIIYEGLYASFISINQDIIDEVKMMSNFNLIIVIKLFIPITKIGVITTLLQAFGLGLKVKVMTEFVANAHDTIGYALNTARAYLKMDEVFAWTILLVVIVISIDLILNQFIKKAQASF